MEIEENPNEVFLPIYKSLTAGQILLNDLHSRFRKDPEDSELKNALSSWLDSQDELIQQADKFFEDFKHLDLHMPDLVKVLNRDRALAEDLLSKINS